MLNWVEHEKSFITTGPELLKYISSRGWFFVCQIVNEEV